MINRMKFILEKSIDKSRLGTLFLINEGGDKNENKYQTPMFFIHTMGGSIPHLTAEVYTMLFGSRACHPILVDIESSYGFHDVVGQFGQSGSKFVGLPMCPSILSVRDPLKQIPRKDKKSFNNTESVSLWPRTGRVSINPNIYSKFGKDFGSSILLSLSDDEINESSVKRVRKSIERTVNFLSSTINSSHVREKGQILATIELAWFIKAEKEAEKALIAILEQSSELGGFALNTLKNENGNKFLQSSEQKLWVENIIEKLPESKMKFVGGPFDPQEILWLVRNGADTFDSSIATLLTEENKAFNLPLEKFRLNEKVIKEYLPGGNDEIDEENQFIINIKDKKYFEDFRPLSSSCGCSSCRKHTRSYIHHLILTSELLGPVLLMAHNLYQLDCFFIAIRNALTNEDGLLELENIFIHSKIL